MFLKKWMIEKDSRKGDSDRAGRRAVCVWKRLCVLAVLLCACGTAWGQTYYKWSGNYNTPTEVQVYNNINGLTDIDAIINDTANWGTGTLAPTSGDYLIPLDSTAIIETLPAEITLYVPSALSITFNWEAEVNGTVINYGAINALSKVTVSADGEFYNHGTLSAEFAIENSGKVENTGSILSTKAGLTNSGTFINSASGTISVVQSVENKTGATFNNAGNITINNTGWYKLLNKGTLNNSGNIKVTGTNGAVENEAGATFEHSGNITSSSVTANGDFTITGVGTIDAANTSGTVTGGHYVLTGTNWTQDSSWQFNRKPDVTAASTEPVVIDIKGDVTNIPRFTGDAEFVVNLYNNVTIKGIDGANNRVSFSGLKPVTINLHSNATIAGDLDFLRGTTYTINLNGYSLTITETLNLTKEWKRAENYGTPTDSGEGAILNVNGSGKVTTKGFDTDNGYNTFVNLSSLVDFYITTTYYGNMDVEKWLTFTSDGTCNLYIPASGANVNWGDNKIRYDNITPKPNGEPKVYTMTTSVIETPLFSGTIVLTNSKDGLGGRNLTFDYEVKIRGTAKYKVDVKDFPNSVSDFSGNITLGADGDPTVQTKTINITLTEGTISAGEGIIIKVYTPDGSGMELGEFRYIKDEIKWTGAAGTTDWGTLGNWSGITAITDITSTSEVVIPSGCAKYPEIDETVFVGTITIKNNAHVTLASGGTLNVSTLEAEGTGYISGASGTVNFAGTSFWEAAYPEFSSFPDITIASGATFTQNSDLYISGNFTNSGTFNGGTKKTVFQPSGASSTITGNGIDTTKFGTIVCERQENKELSFEGNISAQGLTLSGVADSAGKRLKIISSSGATIALANSQVGRYLDLTGTPPTITDSTGTPSSDVVCTVYNSQGDWTSTPTNLTDLGWILGDPNDFVWVGRTNDWNNRINWNTNSVPDTGKNVIIPGGVSLYPKLESDINLGSGKVEIKSGGSIDFNGHGITATGGFTNAGTIETSEASGNVTITGNLTNSGNVTASGTLTVDGDVTLSGGTISGNLSVTGAGTFTGGKVNKDVSITGGVSFATGTAEIIGNLSVASMSVTSGTAKINGTTTITGELSVSGDGNLSINRTDDASSSAGTVSFNTAGNINLGKNSGISFTVTNGDIEFPSTLASLTLGGTITASESGKKIILKNTASTLAVDTTFVSPVEVGADTSFTNGKSITFSDKVSSASGGTYSLTIGASGAAMPVTFNDEVSDLGDITIFGATSISKDLSASSVSITGNTTLGKVTVTTSGNQTYTGSVTLNNANDTDETTLKSTGDTSVISAGAVSGKGILVISGTTTTDKTTTFTPNGDVGVDLAIAGNVMLGSDLTATKNLTVDTGATLTATNVSIDVGNGALTNKGTLTHTGTGKNVLAASMDNSGTFSTECNLFEVLNTLTNSGTFTLSGAGEIYILTNTGTVAGAGTITVTGTLDDSAGTWTHTETLNLNATGSQKFKVNKTLPTTYPTVKVGANAAVSIRNADDTAAEDFLVTALTLEGNATLSAVDITVGNLTTETGSTLSADDLTISTSVTNGGTISLTGNLSVDVSNVGTSIDGTIEFIGATDVEISGITTFANLTIKNDSTTDKKTVKFPAVGTRNDSSAIKISVNGNFKVDGTTASDENNIVLTTAHATPNATAPADDMSSTWWYLIATPAKVDVDYADIIYAYSENNISSGVKEHCKDVIIEDDSTTPSTYQFTTHHWFGEHKYYWFVNDSFVTDGNWSTKENWALDENHTKLLAAAPSKDDSTAAIIVLEGDSSTSHFLTLDGDVSVKSIEIEDDVIVDFGEHSVTTTGKITNGGKIKLVGAASQEIAGGFKDDNAGTVEYSGAFEKLAITGIDPIKYYDLIFNELTTTTPVTLTDNIEVTNDFSINDVAGEITFNGTVTVGNDLKITQTENITFGGATSVIGKTTINSGVGKSVSFTGTTDTFDEITVEDATFSIAASLSKLLTITGTVTLGGNLSSTSDITIAKTGSLSTDTYDITAKNLTIDSDGTDNGSLTVGTDVTPGSGTITLSGDFTNNGTFNCGEGTVKITGSGKSKILGANTFYNFTCTDAGKTILFEGGKEQTVTGKITITGTAGDGNLITLTTTDDVSDPNTASRQWNLVITSDISTDVSTDPLYDSSYRHVVDITYAYVSHSTVKATYDETKYSDLVPLNLKHDPKNCIDGGGTEGWFKSSIYVWIGKVSSDWNDADNWINEKNEPAGVPDITDSDNENKIRINPDPEDRTTYYELNINVSSPAITSIKAQSITINEGAIADFGNCNLTVNPNNALGITVNGTLKLSGVDLTNPQTLSGKVINNGAIELDGGTVEFTGIYDGKDGNITEETITPDDNTVIIFTGSDAIFGNFGATSYIVKMAGTDKQNFTITNSAGVIFGDVNFANKDATTGTTGVTVTGDFTAANVTNSGDTSIPGSGVLNLGSGTITVSGDLTNSGELSGDTGKIEIEGNFTNETAATFTSAGDNEMSISGDFTNAGTLTVADNKMTVGGDFVNEGTLTVGATEITIAKNLTNSGIFDASGCKIILDGPEDCEVSGVTVFNDLTIQNTKIDTVADKKTVAFPAVGIRDDSSAIKISVNGNFKVDGKQIDIDGNGTMENNIILTTADSSADATAPADEMTSTWWYLIATPANVSVNYADIGYAYSENDISSGVKSTCEEIIYNGNSYTTYNWFGLHKYYWFGTSATNGNWSTADNWRIVDNKTAPGISVAPGKNDPTAIIIIKEASLEDGAPYILTLDGEIEKVESIVVGKGTIFDIGANSISTVSGITNNGTIRLAGGSTQEIVSTGLDSVPMTNGADSVIKYNGTFEKFVWDGDVVADGNQFANVTFKNDVDFTSLTDVKIIAGGNVSFEKEVTSGDATITTGGKVDFEKNAVFADATITADGTITFVDDATFAKAEITSTADVIDFVGKATFTDDTTITADGNIDFKDETVFANVIITTGGNVSFEKEVTSGDATITTGGKVDFEKNAVFADATITADGTITFVDDATFAKAEITSTADAIDFVGKATFTDDTTITADGNIDFKDETAFANVIITTGGNVSFEKEVTSGDATIVTGGKVDFEKTAAFADATITATEMIDFKGDVTFASGTVNGKTMLAGNVTTIGTLNFANDVYLYAPASPAVDVTIGTGEVKITGNLIISKEEKSSDEYPSVILNSKVSAKNIVLYRGYLEVNADLTSSEDVVLFGDAYHTKDGGYNHTRLSGILCSYDMASDAFPNGVALPTKDNGFGGKLTVGAGKIVKVGKNFYANGITLTGSGVWYLDVKQNIDLPSGAKAACFVEACSSTIKYSHVRCYYANGSEISPPKEDYGSDPVLAAGMGIACTDDGENRNWDLVAFEILNVYTVTDNVVRIELSARMRNKGADELAGSVSKIKFINSDGVDEGFKAIYKKYEVNANKGGVAFDKEILLQDEDILSEETIDGVTVHYFYLETADGSSWNTDATGTSVGNAKSTDSHGKHQTSIPAIKFTSGGRFINENGKTLDTVDDYYDKTLDKAAPVLTAVYASQETHNSNAAEQHSYDAHNYLELVFSEPVDFGDKTDMTIPYMPCYEDDGITLHTFENERVTSGFGKIENVASGISVAGLVKINSGELKTGAAGISDNTVHAFYRSNPHTIRISIAGFTDGTVTDNNGNEYKKWIGYIDSAKTPQNGSTVELLSDKLDFVNDLAITNVYDDDGNFVKIEKTPNACIALNSDSLKINVSSSETYPMRSDAGWDVKKPGFAVYRKASVQWNKTSITDYEVVGSTVDGTSSLKRIEFHIFDNEPSYNATDEYQWVSKEGWVKPGEIDATGNPILYKNYSYAADIFGGVRPFDSTDATSGGVRYCTVANSSYAFRYMEGIEGTPNLEFDSSKKAFAGSVSPIFQPITSPSRNPSGADGLYFGYNFVNTILSLRTRFTISYDSAAGYITDLAGNRLGSGEKIQIRTKDLTPPSFNMTVAPVGRNKLYIMFAKPLSTGTVKLKDVHETVEQKKALEEAYPNAFGFYELTNGALPSKAVDIDIDKSVPAKVLYQNNDYMGLELTLTRNVTLEDVKKLYVVAKPESKIYKDPIIDVSTKLTTFIHDSEDNYMPAYSAHALSDFAVDVINPLYAYNDWSDTTDDNIQTDLYGDGSQAVHSWDAEQQNYGSLLTGKEIHIMASKNDDTDFKARVYFDNNPPAETLSTEYNATAKPFENWRIWLPKMSGYGMFTTLAKADNGSFDLVLDGQEGGTDYDFECVITKEQAAKWTVGDQVSFLFSLHDMNDDLMTVVHVPVYDYENEVYSLGDKFPLFALRLKTPGDLTSLDLWSFRLKDQKKQRGGVTVLNNVIDASKSEKTVIKIDNPAPGKVDVILMTLDGNVVDYLNRGNLDSGTHFFTWTGKTRNGKTVARGMYFIRVIGNGFDETRKIMVIK